MRSKYILGLLAAGLTLVLVAPGCGSDATDGETGGSGGAGASGSGPTTGSGAQPMTSTGSTMMQSSSTGTPPDTNVDCATAVEMAVNMQGGAGAELDPVDTDEDYFVFDGTEGQVLFLFGDAKPDDDGFADGYPDLVFTLYDAQNNQIAENDDPIPRTTQDSELYTILPATGKYCIRVEDFCKWTADKGQPCPQRQVVDFPEFTVYIAEYDPAAEGNVEHDEAVASTPMEYGVNPNGGYYLTAANGVFDSGTDEDVFTFNIPVDVTCAMGVPCVDLQAAGEQRTTANFELFPTGADGNGSTVPTGKVWITTAADPLTKLAEVDGTKVDVAFGLSLSPPVTFGTEYQVHVAAPVGSTPGANPFYFLIHYGAGSNPLEKETLPLSNDTLATAEAMESAMTTGGGIGYFVAGSIIGGTGDVDWYSFDNAAVAGDVLFATCAGQRIGAGLRGLKLTITDDAGTTVGSPPAETAEEETTFGDPGQAIPIDTGKYFLKVEVTQPQDTLITGNYYQCGIAFGVPQG